MPPEAIPAASSAAPWSAIAPALVLLLVVVGALLSGGCASIAKQLDTLPAGSAQEVHYTRTGKFSSTTIIAKGYAKDPTVTTVAELSVRHSNAWMPNLEIVAKGYRRVSAGPASILPHPVEAPMTDAPVSEYPYFFPPAPAVPKNPVIIDGYIPDPRTPPSAPSAPAAAEAKPQQ